MINFGVTGFRSLRMADDLYRNVSPDSTATLDYLFKLASKYSIEKENLKLENQQLKTEVSELRAQLGKQPRNVMPLQAVAAVQETNSRVSELQSLVYTLEDQKRSLTAKIEEDQNLIYALQKQLGGLQELFSKAKDNERAALASKRKTQQRMETMQEQLQEEIKRDFSGVYKFQLDLAIRRNHEQFVEAFEDAKRSLFVEFKEKEKQLKKDYARKDKLLMERYKQDKQAFDNEVYSLRRENNFAEDALRKVRKDKEFVEALFEETRKRLGFRPITSNRSPS